MKTVNTKDYPVIDPSKHTNSRFASRAVEIEINGKKEWRDELAAAEPELPVTDFLEDQKTGTWNFVARTDASNKIITTRGKSIPPYIPSPELIDLIRLAQILQRPILIKGKPGSGKTQLAKAVAYEWYGNEYKNHFFEWQIKSTSKAADGLYSFDHLARLRDAQLGNLSKESTPISKSVYRQFGPMGKAFLTSTADNPSILLIDEIDKADIDFPNDLLLELDEQRFIIPESETGEVIQAEHPPLIFITSNDERKLPEAFLRRCLFIYVKFPEETLTEIVRAHMPGLVDKYPDFVAAAIVRFKKLRTNIEDDPADNKRVSTSELLDWLQAYYYDLMKGDKDKLLQNLDSLPLYHQALLKTLASVKREKPAEEPRTT